MSRCERAPAQARPSDGPFGGGRELVGRGRGCVRRGRTPRAPAPSGSAAVCLCGVRAPIWQGGG
eukprot:7389879-Prymnesium_polylepis.1